MCFTWRDGRWVFPLGRSLLWGVSSGWQKWYALDPRAGTSQPPEETHHRAQKWEVVLGAHGKMTWGPRWGHGQDTCSHGLCPSHPRFLVLAHELANSHLNQHYIFEIQNSNAPLKIERNITGKCIALTWLPIEPFLSEPIKLDSCY